MSIILILCGPASIPSQAAHPLSFAIRFTPSGRVIGLLCWLTPCSPFPNTHCLPASPPSRAITFLNHTVPDFTDNGASNIIKYGNDYYATSETNYIRKIDPVTLETQDKVAISLRSPSLACDLTKTMVIKCSSVSHRWTT